MNLYEIPNGKLSAELVTQLAGNRAVRIERIVSTGQTSGWYDQQQSEYVALLEGTSVLEYADGRKLTLHRGDTILLSPHEKHRVAYTSGDPPCIWLCIFF